MGDSRFRKTCVPSVMLVVAALSLGACGGDSDDDSTSAGGSGATTTSGSGTSAGGDFAAAVDRYATFTGGTAGKAATGAPVSVGYVHDEGGVPSFPEGTKAANVAVKVINEHLGGVGGRPIKLVPCLITSEAGGQTCAQQMLNDSEIELVIQGVAPVGSASFSQTMAGKKPVVIAGPSAPTDFTAKNAYALSSGAAGAANDAEYIAALKPKKVGVLSQSDDPTAVESIRLFVAGMKKAGIEVTRSTFVSTTSDMVPAMTGTGGNANDALYVSAVSPPNCLAAAKAATSLNITKPIIGNQVCVSPAVKEALGDFPEWTTRWNGDNPYANNTPDAKAYNAAMAEYDNSDIGGVAGLVFPTVLTAAKILNDVGPDEATSASIADALKAFKGPAPGLPPNLTFGKAPTPSLGTPQVKMFTYEGDGKWDNPDWIGPTSR